MCSVLLFTLILLPTTSEGRITEWFRSSSAHGNSYVYLGCNVTRYVAVSYRRDKLLGQYQARLRSGNIWETTDFDRCVEQCIEHDGCKAVNYFREANQPPKCQPLGSGIKDLTQVKINEDYWYPVERDHAYVDCSEPTEPVGPPTLSGGPPTGSEAPQTQAAHELVGKEQSHLGCTVTKYESISYNRDKLLGRYVEWLGRGNIWEATDFEHCVEQCLLFPGCVAVNYFREKNQPLKCQPLGSGIDNPNMAKAQVDYQSPVERDHAYIHCPQLELLLESVGCGKPAESVSASGDMTVPHSWPWHVLLQSDEAGDCGAVLIRVKNSREESDILLTAASCVTVPGKFGDGGFPVYVKRALATAGDHNREKFEIGQQLRSVARLRYHDQYYPPLTKDMTLVTLQKTVRFTDTIRPVCLPESDEPFPVGKRCVVTGWGRKSGANVERSPVLKHVEVKVFDDSACTKSISSDWAEKYDPAQHICVGPVDGSENICMGDAGGPLVCQKDDGSWALHGIAGLAAEETCKTDGAPGIFARVSPDVAWAKYFGDIASRVGLD